MPPVHINVLLVNFSIKNYLILVGADMPMIHICMASMRYDYLCICHIMKTSSNGNILRVTGALWGNSPVNGEFPSQRPVTRDDVIKCVTGPLWRKSIGQRWIPLTKASESDAELLCFLWSARWVNNRRRWFETLSRSLWRHCNVSLYLLWKGYV